MWRTPVVTICAVLSLAIGIGANSALFTVARALLAPAPVGVRAPEQLVDIGMSRDDGGFNPTSYATYVELKARATLLEGLFARPMFPRAMNLTDRRSSDSRSSDSRSSDSGSSDSRPGSGGPGSAESGAAESGEAASGGNVVEGRERVFVQFVTPSWFDTLGATPAVGRLLNSADDDRPGAAPFVVLSHRLWVRRFDRASGVVGRVVRLDSQPFTVIGVAAERFQGTGVSAPDLWAPLGMSVPPRAQAAGIVPAGAASAGAALAGGAPSIGGLFIGARLKPGVSIAAAAAEVAAIGETLRRDQPELQLRGLRLLASSPVPGNQGLVSLLLLFIAVIVGLVLLVACANVAGLLLARASARRREMAVRLAIGAGRARLARQLLIETMMLFAIGGMAGVGVARLLFALLLSSLPALSFPVALPLALDPRIVLFTMALSLGAALLFGLAPALQGSNPDLLSALKSDTGPSGGRARLRQAFVLAQVAFSLVLIIVASLFSRALVRAGSLDPSFDPRGVEVATINFPASIAGSVDVGGAGGGREDASSANAASDAARLRTAQDLLARIRQRADVRAAALARMPPGGFETLRLGDVTTPGFVPRDGEPFLSPDWNIVEPGYFETLRLPIIAGRDFAATDEVGATPVAIVSESVARRLWPERQAVGQVLRRGGDVGATPALLLVVGVVRDIVSSTMIDGLGRGMVYVPLRQRREEGLTMTMTLMVRGVEGRRLGDELRAMIATADPDLVVATARTLEEELAVGRVPQQAAASIAGSLGLVGLLLAAIGIYGVTAWMVSRRLREFGIRLALGAAPADIARLVLGQGLGLTIGGCAIGIALGALAGQVLAGLLFGVPPLDPVSFVGTTLLFVAVGLAACYGPARRATRVDPATPLRLE